LISIGRLLNRFVFEENLGPMSNSLPSFIETTGAGGFVLKVRARAAGSRNAILGTRDGELRVSVTAQPENGKANAAIIKLLAKRLRISKSSVELVSGATNPRKRFLLLGVAVEQLVPLGWAAD
jgi:uncharacterized protein (TIGR00251 family)